MAKQYASLHNHSNLSFQDGLGNASHWINAAKEKNIAGLGITNHGSAGDLMEFYKLSKKENYPVLLGTEFYVIDDRKNKDKDSRYYHMNLWAKSPIGYKNLCILNSKSWTKDRFYYKPRIDFEDLRGYSEGLMCGTACYGGIISKTIVDNGHVVGDKTKKHLEFLIELFGADLYFELLPALVSFKWDGEKKDFFKTALVDGQELVNKAIQDLSKKYNVKIIATADAHMADKKEKVMQDVQIINSYGSSGSGWHFRETYFLPTYDEFLGIWKETHPYVFENNDIYSYLENTLEVLEKGRDIDLVFPALLPEVKENAGMKDLVAKVRERGILDVNNEEVCERLHSELAVLCENGKIDLTNYFLLLEDLVRHCDENQIMVGPGRGSACGSLLCYGLGITKIDPLKYDLSFNRFINEARIKENALPDIDLDFSDPSAVKGYLFKKYGEKFVASIGTIQTLQLRSSLKDTLRVIRPDLTADDLNKLTKGISVNSDGDDAKTYFLKQLLRNPELEGMMKGNKEIYRVVLGLMGQARQRGTHAAAVVISPIKLEEVLPLARNKEDWITQYTMSDVEYCGLIKYDILGLNTLNDIKDCFDLVKERHQVDLSLDKIINFHNCDKEVLKAFERGETYSVFQFNTDVSKMILKKVPINSIEDLAKVTALGRPGTLDVKMHETYIRRVNGKESVKFLHPAVKDVLADTQGIMLYQEQVMKVCQVLGGFNEVDADNIRRGMGKKKYDLLVSYKNQFVENCQKKFPDIDADKANEIWELIEANSRYSFNKCLSPSSLVETSHGDRLLSEIKVGDKVKSFDIKSNAFGFSEVLDVMDRGDVELYEIFTEGGVSIKCSLGHKFLCEDMKIRELKDILTNDIKIMCEI